MTLEQAGEALGLAPATLRSQIRYGKLKGQKVGTVWTVTKREVERYKKLHKR